MILAAAVIAASLALPARAGDTSANLANIKLPPGFEIEVYVEAPEARSMVVADMEEAQET